MTIDREEDGDGKGLVEARDSLRLTVPNRGANSVPRQVQRNTSLASPKDTQRNSRRVVVAKVVGTFREDSENSWTREWLPFSSLGLP